MVFLKTHLLVQAARYRNRDVSDSFGQCGGLKKGAVGPKNLTSKKKLDQSGPGPKKLTSQGPAHKKN